MTATRRWSWAVLAVLVAVEIAYVAFPALATQRIDAALHAHHLPGRASQLYVVLAGLLGVAYALMVAPIRLPTALTARQIDGWVTRLCDSGRSLAARARLALSGVGLRIEATKARYAASRKPKRVTVPLFDEADDFIPTPIIARLIAARADSARRSADARAQADAAAAIASALSAAHAAHPNVDAAASQRREPDLAGGHSHAPQGAPMDTTLAVEPTAPVSEGVDNAPEGLSPAALAIPVAKPIAALLGAILAVAEQNEPKLLSLLDNENVKAEQLIQQAAAHQNPILGYVAGALSAEIVNFLGGEEKALLIAVEAIASAEIAKVAAL